MHARDLTLFALTIAIGWMTMSSIHPRKPTWAVTKKSLFFQWWWFHILMTDLNQILYSFPRIVQRSVQLRGHRKPVPFRIIRLLTSNAYWFIFDGWPFDLNRHWFVIVMIKSLIGQTYNHSLRHVHASTSLNLWRNLVVTCSFVKTIECNECSSSHVEKNCLFLLSLFYMMSCIDTALPYS